MTYLSPEWQPGYKQSKQYEKDKINNGLDSPKQKTMITRDKMITRVLVGVNLILVTLLVVQIYFSL